MPGPPLEEEETQKQCIRLALFSFFMIFFGYPGELTLDNLHTRFYWWILSMLPFIYVVFTLLVGLRGAVEAEVDPELRTRVWMTCVWTVVSWCTYPIVYLTPIFGVSGASAVVAIQIGYCVADVVSKCGVGILIYSICHRKSQVDAKHMLEED